MANSGGNTVSVIATANNTVVTGPGLPISVGSGLVGVAVTSDDQHAYVVNNGSGTFSVIATASNKVVATITLEIGVPYGVDITPDGTRAYMTNQFTKSVSVIATASNTPLTGTKCRSGCGISPVG